jgi:hypothetical protein
VPSSAAGDGAIATGTDAIRSGATDALHERRTQRSNRMGISDMWGSGEIVEIPFVDDDP